MAPQQAPGGTIIERQLVTWAAGIAAAAAVGYVVLGNYFPTFGWSRKMDKDIVPGLHNRYGNDCFANCVVQVYSQRSIWLIRRVWRGYLLFGGIYGNGSKRMQIRK